MSGRMRKTLAKRRVSCLSRGELIGAAIKALPRRYTNRFEHGSVAVLGAFMANEITCYVGLRIVDWHCRARRITSICIAEYRGANGERGYQARHIEKHDWSTFQPGLYPGDKDKAAWRCQVMAQRRKERASPSTTER